MNLNDSETIHDAITSWTENINAKNFTVCAMQSGRKSNNFNPFAIVDWIAYQGAPPEGMTGEIKMQKWWSGTNCADVTFPKVGLATFSFFPERIDGNFLNLFSHAAWNYFAIIGQKGGNKCIKVKMPQSVKQC